MSNHSEPIISVFRLGHMSDNKKGPRAADTIVFVLHQKACVWAWRHIWWTQLRFDNTSSLWILIAGREIGVRRNQLRLQSMAIPTPPAWYDCSFWWEPCSAQVWCQFLVWSWQDYWDSTTQLHQSWIYTCFEPMREIWAVAIVHATHFEEFG